MISSASSGPDIVFNIAEGTGEAANHKYPPCRFLGSRIRVQMKRLCAYRLDKALIKRIVSSYGIRTPKYCVICCGRDDRCLAGIPLSADQTLTQKGPARAFPTLSRDGPEATQRTGVQNIGLYRQDMLVEEYIEAESSWVFSGTARISIFPPMEICWMNRINRYKPLAITSSRITSKSSVMSARQISARASEATDTAKHKLSLRGEK